MKSCGRVLIIDDHPIVRQGLMLTVRNILDVDEIYECDGFEATQLLLDKLIIMPKLAIVDLSLGDGCGIQLMRWILDRSPQTQILALSMHIETEYAVKCLRAGARGYLMKGSDLKEMRLALHSVLKGEIYLSEPMRLRILDKEIYGSGESSQQQPRFATLTPREQELLRYTAEGYRAAAVARAMGIKVKTVNSYKEKLKIKLGLASSAALTAFAVAEHQQEAGR